MKQLMHDMIAPGSAPIHPPPGARRPVLLLGRQAVAELLPLSACIEAVEAAFRALGEARVAPSGTLGHPVPGGGFHVKIASIETGRRYFAAKVNGNFPENPGRRGLPNSTGTAIQDVAAAALVYERAVVAGRGVPVDLAG